MDAITVPVPVVKIIYNQKDVTSELSDFLLEINWTDNIDGQIDELSVTFDNPELRWFNSWYPVKGDTLSSEIGYEDNLINIGNFDIDEPYFSGPPHMIQIRALSAAITKELKTNRSYAYKQKSLKDIVSEIAKRNGLKLYGEIEDTHFIRKTQYQKSDLTTLQELAHRYGYYVAIKEKKLIFEKRSKLKQGKAIKVLRLQDISSYSFKDKTSQVYKAAQIEYLDPKTKKYITYTEKSKANHNSQDTLIIKERVENIAQAKARVKGALAGVNDRQVEGDITLEGDIILVAGQVIELSKDFGILSGNYHIYKAEHNISRASGYTCNLSIRRNEVKSDNPHQTGAVSVSVINLKSPLAEPHKIVSIRSDDGRVFSVQAETARRWDLLYASLKQKYPGRQVIITSTMGGSHDSGKHYEGRAIDFAIVPLSTAESYDVESLVSNAGLKPFNEYVHKSPKWTGPHMHISW